MNNTYYNDNLKYSPLMDEGGSNMYYGASNLIFQKAKELRNRTTPAEEILWSYLHINEWHLKFRRQHPIANYIVDFYCHSLKLVIELDGGIHSVEEVKLNDDNRENHLKELGLTVIRFKNEEVIYNLNKVMETIQNIVNLQHNTPLGDGGMEKLYVIKIGGNIIDDENKLSSFLKSFADLSGLKVLIHGGGKLATRLAEQLGVQQQLIEGRRITDAETLKIVTMVYAGYINKNIVAQLQSQGSNAVGLSGADGNLIKAHKRPPLGDGGIDYGFVGDVDAVNNMLIKSLLDQHISIVIAPITQDKNGQLLNTNADTIAQEIAKAMSNDYEVHLIYSFEKSGVLLNAEDDNSVLQTINPAYYKELKDNNVIFAGMIPKLDNAFMAVQQGVKRVVIGKAEQLHQLITGDAGTSIIHE